MESLVYLVFSLLFINIIFVIFHGYIKKKYNLFDYPDVNRKKQSKPVPLLGGLLFLINIIVFFYFDFFLDSKSFFYSIGFFNEGKILIFCLCVMSMFFVGFVDDKINLNPVTRLILLSLILLVVFQINHQIVINSLKFTFYKDSIDLFNLGIFFSVFCILTYINALNMLDGINLISGIYYLSIIMILFLYNYQIPLATTLLIATIFFIFLNYNGKIYLGDSGVYLVSFILSLAIIGLYESNQFHVEKVFLFMFLPAIDFFRLFIVRLHNRKHPFTGDQNHFHHIIARKYKDYQKILILLFFLFTPILLDFFFIDNELLVIFFMILTYCWVLKKDNYRKKFLIK